MRDLAGIVAMDEATLRREFGVGATHLMEHARGIENCTIAQIQSYEPQQHSISVDRVLTRLYMAGEALTVMREMVDEGVACGQASGLRTRVHPSAPTLTDLDCSLPPRTADRTPQPPHCSWRTRRLARPYGRGRAAVGECHRRGAHGEAPGSGLWGARCRERRRAHALHGRGGREKRAALTQATIAVKQRFGKNALVRGRSFREEATGRDRNAQVGGHNA